MFEDRNQELERLSEELLEEELPTPEETQEDDTLLSEETLNKLLDIDVHNADTSDVDLEEFSEQLQKPEEPKTTGLLVTSIISATGIILILAWWVLRYFGIL